MPTWLCSTSATAPSCSAESARSIQRYATRFLRLRTRRRCQNSLIADGCKIEGKVENSILFRGVTIGKDAVVKNSIVMQGAYVGSGATLNSVIMDKISIIKPDKSLCGTDTFPVYVGKGIVV